MSQQTDLLDSVASMTSTSIVPAIDVMRLTDSDTGQFKALHLTEEFYHANPGNGEGLFLFRLPGGEFSYIEMTHPSDFEATTLRLQRRGQVGGSLGAQSGQ